GEIEKEFGTRLNGGVGGIEKDSADLAADFRAAGFHGFDDLAAVFPQVLCEQADLRGFAAAIHAFEGEELALCGGGWHREDSIFADAQHRSAEPALSCHSRLLHQ